MSNDTRQAVVNYVIDHPCSSRAEIYTAFEDTMTFQAVSQALVSCVRGEYLDHRRGKEKTRGRTCELFFATRKGMQPIPDYSAPRLQVHGYGTTPKDDPILILAEYVNKMIAA